MRGIYKVESYNVNEAKYGKAYVNYKSAYKYAQKLIAKDINCGIYELITDKNADGTDNLDTLRWDCIIGC